MGKNIKPFIAIPVYGSIDCHFFAALMEFIGAAKDFDYQLKFLYGDSLVSRARNSLTTEFLNSDCSHLLFIDSDLVFSLDQIKRVLSHGEDIVGGFYPKKRDGELEFVFNCLDNPAAMDDRRLTPVKYMGTGFLSVARGVFETMMEKLGDEIVFKVDGKDKVGFDFWPVGVYKFKDGTRRYLSEDWYFCQRALDLGYKVYGDNAVILKHSGNAVYPLLSQQENLFLKSDKFPQALLQEVEHYDMAFNFEPRTILDIGANIGAFSHRSKTKWPNAKIYAYEPVPEIYEQLVKNVPFIEANNEAVRDFDGEQNILLGKTQTCNSFIDLGEQTGASVLVSCVDAATLPSCDLVKIDTEGCEVEILRRLDLSKTSAIVLEYHSETDREKLRSIAFEHGFVEVGWERLSAITGILKFVREAGMKLSDCKSNTEAEGDAAAVFPHAAVA